MFMAHRNCQAASRNSASQRWPTFRGLHLPLLPSKRIYHFRTLLLSPFPFFRQRDGFRKLENTCESFSNALWSRAKGRKISKRSTRFYCAPHGRLRGWPNERRGLLPIYFQAVPSGQVFPLTARHASFFERFDDIRYFSRSTARNRAPWSRRHSVARNFPSFSILSG